MASGGVGGLAISLNALFGWNNANFRLSNNHPFVNFMLVLSWYEVLLKTFYGSLVFPTFIKLTVRGLPTLTKQPLLAFALFLVGLY
ncbi:MAG: YitT family protein [Streptococcus sp.]